MSREFRLLHARSATVVLLVTLALTASAAAQPMTRRAAPGPATRPADLDWGEPANGLQAMVHLGTGGPDVHEPTFVVHPGEPISIRASIRNASAGPLALPDDRHGSYTHAALHVRAPAGGHFVYDPWRVHRDPADLPVPHNYRLHLLPSGASRHAIEGPTFATDAGHGWIDADTRKPARLSLGRPGDYDIWMEFAVPLGTVRVKDDAPVWSGRARSDTARLTVRALPVNERRMEPTPEQVRDLAEWLERRPGQLQAGQQLEAALHLAANEGLALHMVELARQRPAAAQELLSLLRPRAVPNPMWTRETAIDGPWLKAYSELVLDVAEGRARLADDERPTGPVYDSLLPPAVSYALAHPEDRANRQRLEALARRYAPIAQAAPWEVGPLAAKHRRLLLSRPSTESSWGVLLALGILRPGMTVAEASALLGEPRWGPTDSKAPYVQWFIPTSSRRQPVITARIAADRIVGFGSEPRD